MFTLAEEASNARSANKAAFVGAVLGHRVSLAGADERALAAHRPDLLEYHETLLSYADGCLRRIAATGGYVPLEAADLVQSVFLALLEGRLAACR